LKEGGVKGNKGLCEGGIWRCVKDMMGIARNNELEFQRPYEHHPF
jgi:hypothetical protein